PANRPGNPETFCGEGIEIRGVKVRISGITGGLRTVLISENPENVRAGRGRHALFFTIPGYRVKVSLASSCKPRHPLNDSNDHATSRAPAITCSSVERRWASFTGFA